MRAIVVAGLAFAAVATASYAQEAERPPPACFANEAGVVDWQACLDASPPDAEWRSLVLINLGTDAYLSGDYASAVRFYDQAVPPGRSIISDVGFHAFRAATYWHVDRREEAMADATLAFRMLHRDPAVPGSPSDYLPSGLDKEMVYVLILPVLQAGDSERFDIALRELRGLPIVDWMGASNRAAVLQQIGDMEGALAMSTRALGEAPDDPQVNNNHCYILYLLERSAQALPFCERAVAGAPDVAAVRDSMAQVLAGLGRCAEAEQQIAQARRLDPASPSYREPLVCAQR